MPSYPKVTTRLMGGRPIRTRYRTRARKAVRWRHEIDIEPDLLTGDDVSGRQLPPDRSQCPEERPCPYLSCRYHLASQVRARSMKFREDLLDHLERRGPLSLLGHTCALDEAGMGEHTLEEIGEILGITREGVRQIEARALWKLNRRYGLRLGGEQYAHVYDQREKECAHCGEEFFAMGGEKCCSSACHAALHPPSQQVPRRVFRRTCTVCDAEFSVWGLSANRQYCGSDWCMRVRRAARETGLSIVEYLSRTCGVCGDAIAPLSGLSVMCGRCRGHASKAVRRLP